MKFFELCFDLDNYENLQLSKEASVEYYQMFDGRKLRESWLNPEVKRMEPEEGKKLGDAPGFNIPVFNKRAIDVLLPLIEDDIEILPLEFEGGELYGINVITVLDAVDYNLSEYVTFRDGKRIMAFRKYAFKKDVIYGKNIFKIIDERLRYAFVSEKFYDLVKEHELEGFKMEYVCDI